MEHILDVDTELFTKVKEHEIEEMEVPARVRGQELRRYDTIKLYHPGDEAEALRIEISDIKAEECASSQESVRIAFTLLEWMYRLDTDVLGYDDSSDVFW